MALSDTKLRSLLNKKHDKLLTITGRDSLSVRVTPHGKIIFQAIYILVYQRLEVLYQN